MIAFLAPAKKIKPPEGKVPVSLSRPELITSAGEIRKHMCGYSPWELETVLKTNPILAEEAWRFFQDFDLNAQGTAALASFQGLAYQQIKPQDFSAGDYLFAQDHLRILSGFYGVLRPLDGILPYRLDFLSRVKLEGKDLYHYWGDKVYQLLKALEEPLVHISSAEYGKLVIPFLSGKNEVIHCRFLVRRGGKFKSVATEAKMARGQLARFMVKERLRNPIHLKEFSFDGYEFSSYHSQEDNYVYIKDYNNIDKKINNIISVFDNLS